MNNIQLYVVLFMVLASIVSSIAKKAREAAEQRRAQAEIERRRLEALRTGRTEDDARGEDPAAELAKRREAQLEELRRIQRERARAQAAGARSAPGRASQTRAPSGPVPRQQPQRQAQPQSPARRGPTSPDPRVARQSGVGAPAAGTRVRDQAVTPYTGESTTHRIVADAAPAPGVAPVPLPPATGHPWRDAFLLQELLGPPLSMREARIPGLDSLSYTSPGLRPRPEVPPE